MGYRKCHSFIQWIMTIAIHPVEWSRWCETEALTFYMQIFSLSIERAPVVYDFSNHFPFFFFFHSKLDAILPSMNRKLIGYRYSTSFRLQTVERLNAWKSSKLNSNGVCAASWLISISFHVPYQPSVRHPLWFINFLVWSMQASNASLTQPHRFGVDAAEIEFSFHSMSRQPHHRTVYGQMHVKSSASRHRPIWPVFFFHFENPDPEPFPI